MIATKKLRAVDLFCGAGGSTTGAQMSGVVDVVLAVNHWRVAIATHSANHPATKHVCARIDQVDPVFDRSIPAFDVLLASPSCVHFSVARGGVPVCDQERATPWHVVLWAEAKRPRWIVVENVRELLNWGPVHNGRPIESKKGETFKAWAAALESLGYRVEWKLLNAADYGEATKRIRLFIVARLGGRKIPWPRPTHAGKWRAAAEVIDWSRPCPSIFSRKRPLADKTLKRIEMGLRRFVSVGAAEQFIVRLRGTGTVASVDNPLDTVTAGGTHHGLATPFLVKYHGGVSPSRDGSERSLSVDAPLATIDTQPRFAVAMPFQYQLIGNGAGRSRSISVPMPTQVAARENHGIVVPYLFDVNHGGDDARVRDIGEPLATITTKRGVGVAMPQLSGRESPDVVVPFLTKYHGTGGAESVDDPFTTLTTKHRHGLAQVSLRKTMDELGVVDVGFRMLDVDELAAAQGFPKDYQLTGSKADQIRQVGNAVCPGVMRAICETIGQAEQLR